MSKVSEERDLKRQIKTLYKVNEFIASISNLHRLLKLIMEESKKALCAEASSLMLYDPENKELFFEVALGKKGKGIKKIRLKLGEGIAGTAAKKTRIINVPDVTKSIYFYQGADSKSGFITRSVLAAPLLRKGKLIGVLEVLNKRNKKPFNREDVNLMQTIAAQAAIAIENAQLYAENLKTERLAAVGQTVAGLSHYIKNLLTGIEMGKEMVHIGLEDKDRETFVSGWETTEEYLNKVSNLVLDMLNYSKERKPLYHLTKLNEIIKQIAASYRGRAKKEEAKLIINFDPHLNEVSIESQGMERVLLNLIGNALDALGGKGGKVEITTHLEKKKNLFQIKVRDTGCGIPEEQIKKIFGFFYSTKGSKGTGIGLAVVEKIIKEHQGTIKVTSKVGKGTTFTITLPYSKKTIKS